MRVATTIITVACGTVSAIALQKAVLIATTPDNPPPQPDDTKADRTTPTPTTAVAAPETLPVARSIPAPKKVGQKKSTSAIAAELAKVDAKINRPSSAFLPGLKPLPTIQVPRTLSVASASSFTARETALPEISAGQKRIPQGQLSTQETPLGDIQGHWAQPAIESLASRGIVQGFTDGSFRPDQPVTGTEFATMAQKAFRESPISYRDLKSLTSDRVATRADAAALIYRTLAKAEAFPSDTAIQVSGEVVRPGAYTLSARDVRLNQVTPTVTRAIQQAGGARSTANLRHVQIHRATATGTKQIIEVNVWQLLQSGDPTQDLALQQGDKLVIPTAAPTTQSPKVTASTVKVNVLGAVAKPGTVHVSTVSAVDEALEEAGEANPDRSRVQLIRFNSNGTISQQLVGANTSTSSPILRDNDVLLVSHPELSETPILSKPMIDLLSRVLSIAVS